MGRQNHNISREKGSEVAAAENIKLVFVGVSFPDFLRWQPATAEHSKTVK